MTDTETILMHQAPEIEIGDPVRTAAAAWTDLLRRHRQDPSNAPAEVVAALSPLIPLRADLFNRAAVRPSKNPGHQMSTLYFDPSLMIQIVGAPHGFRLPVHTHSAWNVLFVCEGEMQFKWYRRLDDRSVSGRSQLEVADDRVLEAGDAGIVGRPPHDIHELEVYSDYLWMVVVTPEPEVQIREIHDPVAGTYELQTLSPLPPRGRPA